jgi:hypothetical protein
METELTIAEEVQRTLSGFWDAAAQNVRSLSLHEPDLVIGLAHGGILPTKATAAAWTTVTGTPFPPVLYVNLGREKVRRYRDERKAQGSYDFYGEHSSYTDVLDFLSWLGGQAEWLISLRQQIAATVDKTPQSIIVIDEMSAQGSTRLLTLGMLDLLYPQAVCHFLDGPYFEWRSQLSQYWLHTHFVDLYHRLKEEEANHQYEFRSSLYDIASGTEDIDENLLNYRTLSPENEAMAYLIRILPIEHWMEMPVWIEDLVIQYVTEQAKTTSLSDLMARYDWLDPHKANRLAPYLLLKHIRRWGQITLKESSLLLGVPEAEVKDLLDWLMLGTRFESRFADTAPVMRMRTSAGVTYGYTEQPPLPEPPVRQSKQQLARRRQARSRMARQRKRR